jgi:hypothetical protein
MAGRNISSFYVARRDAIDANEHCTVAGLGERDSRAGESTGMLKRDLFYGMGLAPDQKPAGMVRRSFSYIAQAVWHSAWLTALNTYSQTGANRSLDTTQNAGNSQKQILRVFQNSGRSDEWHLDLEKTVTVEKLGSYPACPDSRKEPDLRAIRRSDEWHLDLEKTVTVEKLGSYPACPDSRKEPDLRAIRRSDRSRQRRQSNCLQRVGPERATAHWG